MNIRVTGQSQVANTISYIRRQSSAAALYQDQIASGVRLKNPSDAPGDYAALAQAKAASGRHAGHRQNAADATADLNAGVSALLDVNAAIVRAKQIAQEGLNGSTGRADAEALAVEVDDLIDRVVRAGNTQSEGRYLFGGTATAGAPFRVSATDGSGRPTAVAYDGAHERARVLVGPGRTADTRYAGNTILQKSGADVFGELIALRTELRSAAPNADRLTTRLKGLDAAREAVSATVAEQSSNLATLAALDTRLTDQQLGADTEVGRLESTDYVEAIVKLRQQENGLEASLSMSARLFQTSLLDFIR